MRTEKNMMYKAFDKIAIEIYVDGELTATHYVSTFGQAYKYAKSIEKLSESSEQEKAELKFYTCDQWGTIIDEL